MEIEILLKIITWMFSFVWECLHGMLTWRLGSFWAIITWMIQFFLGNHYMEIEIPLEHNCMDGQILFEHDYMEDDYMATEVPFGESLHGW